MVRKAPLMTTRELQAACTYNHEVSHVIVRLCVYTRGLYRFDHRRCLYFHTHGRMSVLREKEMSDDKERRSRRTGETKYSHKEIVLLFPGSRYLYPLIPRSQVGTTSADRFNNPEHRGIPERWEVLTSGQERKKERKTQRGLDIIAWLRSSEFRSLQRSVRHVGRVPCAFVAQRPRTYGTPRNDPEPAKRVLQKSGSVTITGPQAGTKNLCQVPGFKPKP